MMSDKGFIWTALRGSAKKTGFSPRKGAGFTLIELIVTISIIAILVAILVVAINPAEQLQRARDTQRVADLQALKSAINFYLATATTTINLSGDATANQRCVGGGGTVTLFTNMTTATSSPSGFGAVATSTNQTVGSSGWLPARMDQTPGGVPLSHLPLDPAGAASTQFYYAYACDANDTTFELTARLESNYYKSDLDLDGTDGGNSSTSYEVGTKLTIIPDNH